MPDQSQTPQPPQPAATDGGEPATVNREEFQKIANLTQALSTGLRKDTDAMNKRLAAMEEAFKALSESSKPTPDPMSGDKPDPRVAAAETRIREMETRLEEERKQREQVEQARMAQERKTALASALTAKGVTGALLKAAMATIYDAEQRVVHDEKGIPGLKFTRKTTAGDYDEILPIDAGLDELFKQEDYRIFLPPRPVQGAGTVPGRAAGAKPTKEQEKAAALAQLLPAMFGRG